MELDRTDAPAAGQYATVYAAFELSKRHWKLGVMLPGSEKMSRSTIAGGDLPALTNRLAEARAKAARCGGPVRMLSCYEAGYDGHWLHRWLTNHGVVNREKGRAAPVPTGGRANGWNTGLSLRTRATRVVRALERVKRSNRSIELRHSERRL